jgi:hypothetical protein
MTKKISFIILSVAIVVTGYFAFRNLNYWERSVRIFKMNSDQPFGRGREGFEGRGGFDRQRVEGQRFDRNAMRQIPDSLRKRLSEAERERLAMREGTIPDSIRQRFKAGDRRHGDRMSFEGGRGRGGDRSGGGEFRNGRNISLGTVGWFLAVFAAFTVITIYLDKAFYLVRKRK